MGVVLFFMLVPTMTIGWKDNLRHLETWYERVATNEQVGPAQQFNVHSVRNQGLANAVYRLGNWLEFKVADGPDDRIADNLVRTEEKLPMDTADVDHLITGQRPLAVGNRSPWPSCSVWACMRNDTSPLPHFLGTSFCAPTSRRAFSASGVVCSRTLPRRACTGDLGCGIAADAL
jgi:hypothetical protein